jgi:hypothetical protein
MLMEWLVIGETRKKSVTRSYQGLPGVTGLGGKGHRRTRKKGGRPVGQRGRGEICPLTTKVLRAVRKAPGAAEAAGSVSASLLGFMIVWFLSWWKYRTKRCRLVRATFVDKESP